MYIWKHNNKTVPRDISYKSDISENNAMLINAKKEKEKKMKK
jgi:hypothetical protein